MSKVAEAETMRVTVFVDAAGQRHGSEQRTYYEEARDRRCDA